MVMSQESVTDYSSDDSTASASGPIYEPTISTVVSDNNKAASSGDLTRTVESISRNAILAVNRLRMIGDEAKGFLQDEAVARELDACFKDILLFLEAETTGLLDECEEQDYIDCIICLFDVAFLSILFDIRSQLLQSASIDCRGDMIFCSVDRIFARCWDGVSCIAGCRRSSRKPDDLPAVSNHKEENDLRIASQLPHTRLQLSGLLRSEYTSPASKRLVLCLLFASFVLRSDLENRDPWAGADSNPGYITECLQPLLEEFVVQARALGFPESGLTFVPLKIAHAMAIALYSSAQAASQRHKGQNLEPFQPYTLACSLELMQYIFPPSSGQSQNPRALDNLDGAQTILLHWGNTVPWAWEKWDDPRVIGFDTVTKNWLCHFEKSLPMKLWDKGRMREESDTFFLSFGASQFLRAVLRMNPRSSLIALFHQICDENDRKFISENRLNCIRLYRTTWCIAELVEACGDMLSSDDISLAAERLILFFAELGEKYDSGVSKGGSHLKRSSELLSRMVAVKSEVVRGLNVLKPEITEKVLLSLQKNVPFFSMFAGSLKILFSMITADITGRFLLDPGVADGLVALLDLISLFYKHNATRCIPVTTFQLLSDLVKFLSKRIGTLALRTALLNCLGYAYMQCQTARSGVQNGKDRMSTPPKSNEESPAVKLHKTWDDEEAFNLALDVTCGDLELAAAFALYVSIAVKKTMDTLLVTEAWDYLRDILLLLVNGHLEKDRGELFLQGGNIIPEFDETFPESFSGDGTEKFANAAERICTALEAVLKRSDTVVGPAFIHSLYIKTLEC
ncbi:hypothetical protein A7U60_g6726 [Sanghuangporus baumii]|uniref:Uncharacterized protein n=1 Tax=Sanghuangporus baumii TaxID=108892 RepID=A0A9Q5HUN7_SANBA|nr:hypothetical protein A7U60_g6726 [Sanghuangporus baumii]